MSNRPQWPQSQWEELLSQLDPHERYNGVAALLGSALRSRCASLIVGYTGRTEGEWTDDDKVLHDLLLLHLSRIGEEACLNACAEVATDLVENRGLPWRSIAIVGKASSSTVAKQRYQLD